MKKLHIIFLSIFILSSINLFAQDSTRVEQNTKNNDFEKYHIYLIGGGGIARFNKSDLINSSPTINLGLDIPLSKAYICSLEFMGHSWIARKQSSNGFYEGSSISIDDKLIMQIAGSIAFKVHFAGEKNSPFRSFFHIGLMVGTGSRYNGLDLGFGFNYKLSKKLRIQLSLRGFSGDLNFVRFSVFNPTLYLVNLSYTL